MPRIVSADFSDFEQRRARLVAQARQLVDEDRPAFREAGNAIAAEYPLDASRTRLQAAERTSRAKSNGQPTVWVGRTAGHSQTVKPDQATAARARLQNIRAGDNLRAARLALAAENYIGRECDKSSLVRPLGAGLPEAARRDNARRMILIALAIVDTEATTGLGDLFDLAKAPQLTAGTSAIPIVGRAEVCLLWGRECLDSLQGALAVLEPRTDGPSRPDRLTVFVPSADPRVTGCKAWKALMQFREELLTNPRRDSGLDGWWSRWIGTMQHWLYGGGDWGDGYYGPGHRVITPDAADCLDTVKRVLHAGFGNARPFRPDAGDDTRTVLFPPNSTYNFRGLVIDWAEPFPPIAERGPIVEWVESWIDRIQYTEATGRYPWEPDAPPISTVSVPPDLLDRLQRAAVDPSVIDRAALAMFKAGPVVNKDWAGNRGAERDGLQPAGTGKGGKDPTGGGVESASPPAGPNPPMVRPVLVSEAAEPASKRPDVLLEMLRARHYPIGGVKGSFVAELDHILVTVPKKRRAIQRWADEKYPAQ